VPRTSLQNMVGGGLAATGCHQQTNAEGGNGRNGLTLTLVTGDVAWTHVDVVFSATRQTQDVGLDRKAAAPHVLCGTGQTTQCGAFLNLWPGFGPAHLHFISALLLDVMYELLTGSFWLLNICFRCIVWMCMI
jgi:hypothetical protein